MPSRSTSRPSWLGSCRLLARPIWWSSPTLAAATAPSRRWSPPDGSPAVTYTSDRIHSRHGYRWRPCRETLYPDRIEQRDAHLSLQLHHWPDATKPRSQYLELLEVAANEQPHASTTTTTTTPAANPVLPETGQDSSPALVAAAAVAVTGTIATFLARRRRRPAN